MWKSVIALWAARADGNLATRAGPDALVQEVLSHLVRPPLSAQDARTGRRHSLQEPIMLNYVALPRGVTAYGRTTARRDPIHGVTGLLYCDVTCSTPG